MRTYLVTGGAGFIGGNFVLGRLRGPHLDPALRIVNLDALTYAGNPDTLAPLADESRHVFREGRIEDRRLVDALLAEFRPQAVINFAAETHVDRSIEGPADFVATNVTGTLMLLESALAYWKTLSAEEQGGFRFLQVSTDEVYGSLGTDGRFTEETRYAPNSPYAASKAAADHLVRAYHHTYGLPVLTTNCSNNYGPYQFPEKLIPLMILKGLSGEALPVYGDGGNVRDWLYVEDHCEAVEIVLRKGRPGEFYNIGGNCEKTNLDVVSTLCGILDEHNPGGRPHDRLISFVDDRPGHDRRYAIDARKIKGELGWSPGQSFESGLEKTVDWYLSNRDWCKRALARKGYGMERLGLRA